MINLTSFFFVNTGYMEQNETTKRLSEILRYNSELWMADLELHGFAKSFKVNATWYLNPW